MTKWKYTIEIVFDENEISQLLEDGVIEEGGEDHLIEEHLENLDFVTSAVVKTAYVL